MAELRRDLNLTSEQADRAYAALYQVTFERIAKAKPCVKDEAETLLWRDAKPRRWSPS